MATLFLDLYGVLADSTAMQAAYNARMAAILQSRYGGSIDAWRGFQQRSYERYLEAGLKLDARPAPQREGDAWVEAVRQLDIEQVRWVLSRAGVPLPDDAPGYSTQLEEETVREIDAMFEDVRPMLPTLRAAGHRLFLSTNATRSNAEPALVGGGVRDLFEGIVCLENAKAKKDRPAYWRHAFEIARVLPEEAVCVDDVSQYLLPAEELGARCVEFRRRDPPRNVQHFPILTSLGGLAAYLEPRA